MVARARFEFDGRNLRRNIKDLPPRVERNVKLAVEHATISGEVHLKNDAPWTDRTGAARAGLHTTSSGSGGSYEIVFAHTVDYGIWLEVKNSGKYEAIMPAVLKTGKELMGNLGQVFK